MDADRREYLDRIADLIQKQWGEKALGRLVEEGRSLSRLPANVPVLDDLTDGGIPIGNIIELTGLPTSGMTTLALMLAASLQGVGQTVAWIDCAQALSFDYALHCGIDLDDLLLVHPENAPEALAITGDLALSQSVDLVVVAPGVQVLDAPAGGWQRLALQVNRTQTTVVVLVPDGNTRSTNRSHVALRLHVERTGWRWDSGSLTGWESRVMVIKNKLGPAGQSAAFSVHLPELAA